MNDWDKDDKLTSIMHGNFQPDFTYGHKNPIKEVREESDVSSIYKFDLEPSENEDFEA